MMHHLSDEEILAYRDGQESSPALARHMETCASCRKKVQAAQRLARLLRLAEAEPLLDASVSAIALPAAMPENAGDALIRAIQEDFQSRIRHSQVLGMLIVQDAASKRPGIRYRNTAVDEHFLAAGEEVQKPPAGAADRQNESFEAPVAILKAASDADTAEFENSGLHIAAQVLPADGGLDLHICVSNAPGRSALRDVEMTLLRASSPPATVLSDPEGNARLSIAPGRSILLIYADRPAHLGLEVVS